MGKLSVLLGIGMLKLVVELVKVLELVWEVVWFVLVVVGVFVVFVVVVGVLLVDLMKKLESLLKEYFLIVDLKEVLMCV